MGAELVAWSFTSGWASGINAYAVVVVMGLLGRFAGVEAVPGALQRTDVLIVAGILFLLEVFADKIPFIDSTWDTVHTAIRPVVGATVGYLIGNQNSSLDGALFAATGGVTALISHFAKAGIRLGVNSSPEPVSNVVVSTAEDVAVTGVISLAAAQPFVAAGVAAVLLLAGVVLAFWLVRRVRRFKRRYDEWGERTLRRGIARAD